MLRLATETSTQLRILRGNALRAGVFFWQARIMTQPSTIRAAVAAGFLGTKQGGDDHVTTGLELAVALDDDAGAQAVQDQRLAGFRTGRSPTGCRRALMALERAAPVPPS